jgi:hypothetical protein
MTPLNQASTEKLYKWSGRLVAILDVAIKAHDAPAQDDTQAELAELIDQPFLNDVYDLFKQLANRRSEA